MLEGQESQDAQRVTGSDDKRSHRWLPPLGFQNHVSFLLETKCHKGASDLNTRRLEKCAPSFLSTSSEVVLQLRLWEAVPAFCGADRSNTNHQVSCPCRYPVPGE